MRIIVSTIVLAALAVPTGSFQIVMMSNYLDSLGGKQPVKQSVVPPAPPIQPAPPQAPSKPEPMPIQPPESPISAEDEPVMRAMNELTQNFVRNEEATLLALKEISSSMRILADRGGIGGAATPPPPPPPVVKEPPPEPVAEVAPEPIAEALPAPVPVPAPSPVVPPPPPPPQKLTPAEQIAYASAKAPPPKAPAPAPKEAPPPPPPMPPSKPAFAKRPLTPAEKIAYSSRPPLPPGPAPQPKPAWGAAPKSSVAPAPVPAPAPALDEKPTPAPGGDDNALAGLPLFFAGLGLLYALVAQTDYAKNLPNFEEYFPGLPSISSMTQERLGSLLAPAPAPAPDTGSVSDEGSLVTPESVESDTVDVPEAAAPDSPSAPEPVLEEPTPVPEAEAAPVPEPVPEPETIPEPEVAAEAPPALEAPETPPVPEAPPVAETPATPEPEAPPPPAPEAPPAAVGGAAAGLAGAATAAGAAPAKSIGSVFSYDPLAENGPSSWSLLEIDGNECGGKKQSPIAIGKTGCNIGANYKMETEGKCSVADLEYTLGRGGPKASFSKQCGSSTLQIPLLEGLYEAVQFHTHIGSEHVIGGERFGAELHIVHKEKDGGRFAVVGIMLNGDGKVDNPAFGRLLDKWSAVEKKVSATCAGEQVPTKNRPVVSDSTFNVYDLVPTGSSFYHYDGSLTTPPCSEVVWWEVADKPLSISPDQYERLVKMTTSYTDPSTCELKTAASPLDGSTNRPVAQDITGRSVRRICPVGGIAPSGSNSETLVAMADSPPIVAEVIPAATTSAPPPAAQQNTLVASSTSPSPQDDPDYDPYRGL